MLRTRVIPCLQLVDRSLVKTVQFDNYNYIGDPVNTVRIFNELEVDELCLLDIRATVKDQKPNFDILREIADECFMPLSYGGGIDNKEMAKRILSIGFEKVVINTAAATRPEMITEVASETGSQSVIVSIDIKKNWLGHYHIYIKDGTEKLKTDPVEYAQKVEELGAGEILLTSINRDGTWEGFDLEITHEISESVQIPVIANGGAGSVTDIGKAIKKGGASAVALGSMVVYQKKGMGVLVNFPDKDALEEVLTP